MLKMAEEQLELMKRAQLKQRKKEGFMNNKELFSTPIILCADSKASNISSV